MNSDCDLYINRNELQLVFNILGPHVTIDFPPYEKVLIEARQQNDGYRFSKLASSDDINEMFEMYDHPEFFDYQSFVQCFLLAGMISYQNIDSFKHQLKIKREGLSSVKNLFFALDTNLLYDRFITTSDIISPSQVLLVDTVQKEILHHVNNKFDRSQWLDRIKDLVSDKTNISDTSVNLLYNELLNRNMKSSRIASHIAIDEYKYLRSQGIEIRADKDNAENSRENDQIIAESVHQYQEKYPFKEIILLTADSNMRDVCDTVGIDSIYLQKPTIISNKHCNSRQFTHLLYYLTVLCGFVKINTSYVFSEFQGSMQEYPLKIRLLNKSDYDEVKKHINLCRSLITIGKKY